MKISIDIEDKDKEEIIKILSDELLREINKSFLEKVFENIVRKIIFSKEFQKEMLEAVISNYKGGIKNGRKK